MPFRIIAFLAAAVAFAQTPSVKQLMLDLIHPASNEILLSVNRGGPADEKEWAAVRRAAISLTAVGPALKDSKPLIDAATAAYQAALAKDAKALAAAAESLDASCTACHKRYRPDVFPHERGPQ